MRSTKPSYSFRRWRLGIPALHATRDSRSYAIHDSVLKLGFFPCCAETIATLREFHPSREERWSKNEGRDTMRKPLGDLLGLASCLLFGIASAVGQQSRPAITGVSHMCVYSSDAAASDNFYAHILGATKGPDPQN